MSTPASEQKFINVNSGSQITLLSGGVSHDISLEEGKYSGPQFQTMLNEKYAEHFGLDPSKRKMRLVAEGKVVDFTDFTKREDTFDAISEGLMETRYAAGKPIGPSITAVFIEKTADLSAPPPPRAYKAKTETETPTPAPAPTGARPPVAPPKLPGR